MRLFGGLCAVKGDLVIVHSSTTAGAMLQEEGRQQQRRPEVRPLMAADVEGEAGKDLVYQVVLPLPGPGVVLPDNIIGEVGVDGRETTCVREKERARA